MLNPRFNIVTSPSATVNTDTIYLGIRVQDLLLIKNKFSKICGFFLPAALAALLSFDQPEVTSFKISYTKNVQKLALVEELTFTLVPIDPEVILNSYNTI